MTTRNWQRLKCALLANGARVGTLPPSAKRPHRIRSGSCGGLDVVLPDGVYVNVPIRERFAASSPYSIDFDEDTVLLRDDRADIDVELRLVPEPDYYQGGVAVDGVPLKQIGQVCGDRLGIGLTNSCVLWNRRSDRCRFCSIGLNVRSGDEVREKPVDLVGAVVDAAVSDRVSPARHVLLGGGTPNLDDGGAARIAEAARTIRDRHPGISIYAMIVPPVDLDWIDRLFDSGVAELGINIELFDDDVAARDIPGKHRHIGRRRYVKALERAVRVFGPVNARSIVIVGLEPAESTVTGVRQLAEAGVMPILSPFRPLDGTDMEHHPRLSGDALWELGLAADEAVRPTGIPLGPTCVPCQGNTVNPLPHSLYRYY